MTLTNKTLPAVILPRLNEQQREIYTVMQQLKGNKPYLWEGIYNGGEDTGPSYEIPGEALDDPAFAALMEEATKYIGWPYVWGGSSPSTSFDCSGFVCWVYTASGVHNLPRTTAQGMAEAGISNAGAYVRKMALNGYILHIDLAPIKELIALQRRCSNNLNQVAVHAHTYGVYPEEIDGLKRDYETLWGEVSKVLRELSELVAK